MKNLYKIIVLSVLLCIGFIPNSTGASFEPAKTALYLGDDNPGNYSLLQYAIEHGSSAHKNSINSGIQHETGLRHGGDTIISRQSIQLVLRITAEGRDYRVPFSAISLLLSPQQQVS